MNLPSGIKLRQLEYFLAVADTRHFTQAAKALFVSQSTVSHQIAELESRLGTPLLNRIGKTVRLTAAGELLRAHAARALMELRAGGDAMAELAGVARGELRIGIIQSFCFNLLPPILEKFVRGHPGVRVRIDNLPAGEIEGRLARGDLDLGIAFAPATLQETEAEPIFGEPLLLVVAGSHALAGRKRCAMALLDRRRMALLNPEFSTRQIIDGYFAEAGVMPDVVCETNAIEVLLAAVRSGELATILPKWAFTPQRGLVAVPLYDPTPMRVSALLWNRHTFRSHAARTFAAMVRESFPGAAPRSPLRRPRRLSPASSRTPAHPRSRTAR